MGSINKRMLKRLFQATPDDISSIEGDCHNATITVYDITEQRAYKCKDILPDVEFPVCEQICIKLAKELGIGFFASQLLGLQVRDIKTKCSRWVCCQDHVKADPGEEICLRLRHIPTKQGCSRLKEWDRTGLEYLYFQISDDFLHENLKLDSIAKGDGLGLVIISLLIKLRLSTEQSAGKPEDLNAFLKSTDVISFVPKTFMNKNFLDKITLRKSIKEKLCEVHRNHPADKRSSLDLMTIYLEHILGKDDLADQFYQEVFEGEMVVSGLSTVQIGIQVDKGNSAPSIKLINTQLRSAYFTCEMKDLTRLEINKRDLTLEGGTTQPVHGLLIARIGGVPQNVYFSSESDVKSLVLCIESFCRLTVDYYSSLCPQLAPKWYTEMIQAKVHGPSSPEYFERILKVKFSCQPDRYILYKSPEDFDVYKVIYLNSAKKAVRRTLGKVEHTSSGYKFQGDVTEPERDLRTLLRRIVGTLNLAPSNSIRPQTEVCDTIYQLLVDAPVPRLTAENEIEADDQRRLEQQPKVFLPADVEISHDSLIGRGHFTEVRRGVLMEDDPVVVKTLRLSEIPDEYKHLCSKSLQDAMVKQMKFNNPLRHTKFNNLALFLGFVGIGLDASTQMILEDTGNKSLKDFLRFREPKDTLRPQQLNDAMLNIANALWFMENEKLYHGNLNCANIIIRRYDSDSHTLSVKLADPGMVSLYNQMPLDSEVNKKRVPWLSPKLFSNLSSVSISTEVYAFGTTVWEMFNSGWGPLDIGQQLNGWSHEKVLEFYRSGSHLGLPVYLEEDKSDPEQIKIMKRKTFEIIQQCWALEESEMVLPERIVKDINNGVGNYGNVYHEYNIIDYSDGLSSVTNLSSVTSGHASLVYQRQFRDVPDLSCLHRTGNAHQPANGHTTPHSPESHDQNGGNSLAAGELTQQSNRPRSQMPTVSQLNDPDQTVPKTVEQRPAVGGVKSPTQTGISAVNIQRQPALNGSSQTHTTRPVLKNIDYLIAEGRLKIDHSCILGQGHYGAVYKGELTPSSSSGRRAPIKVAVKRLKREMVDKYAEDFRKEIVIMQDLDHENIVKFYGIYRGEENIVMEYLEGGSLFHYVTKNKNIPQEMFIRISLDIARGMEYLWSMKVLHMDLACRNVLLTSTQQAKVSDFGLSKVLVGKDEDYYRRKTAGKVIPVFWCAMEWLKQERFTTKCDVWSFGITMWEMCSHGKKPNICKDDVTFQREGFARMKNGERLPKPENCRLELYQLMRDCWLENEDMRPYFSDCVTRLQQMMPQQPSPSGKPTGSDSTTPHGTNRGDNLAGSQAAAPPGDDKGDNQECLQKTLSQDRETNSNRKSSQNHLQKTLSQNSETNSESDQDDYHKMTAGGDADNNPIASTGNNNSEKEKNSKDSQQTCTNTQNSVDNRERTTEIKLAYIDEKDLTLTDECLGKGSFGKVVKGKLKENGKEIDVAVKMFDFSDELYRRFKREMQLLGNVSHRNIVRFRGMVRHARRTEQYVMELMRCTLTEYLIDRGKHDRLHTKLGSLLDIAQGMSYLAEKSILHCDLTAVNILLAFDLTAKISDLGLSKRLDMDKTETGLGHYKRHGAQFKLFWSAPEVFEKEVYTRSSDVWSYGVVCLEVFLNEKPLVFRGKTSHDWKPKMGEYSERINRGERFSKPEGCPDNVYDLMNQCWSVYPEKRPTFDLIVEKMSQFKETAHTEDLRKGRWRPI